MSVNKITEITFDSAQYLPPIFGKCNNLHGHTVLVKNLKVWTTKIVDFSIIKDFFKQMDHLILSPEKHKPFWLAVQKLRETYPDPDLPQFKCLFLPVEEVTVEALGNWIFEELQNIDGVNFSEFELYETPTQGVMI